ncbi:putative 1-phosphatidylinositol-3-phosphate 5-kinase FAB1D [Drosera capensis]
MNTRNTWFARGISGEQVFDVLSDEQMTPGNENPTEANGGSGQIDKANEVNLDPGTPKQDSCTSSTASLITPSSSFTSRDSFASSSSDSSVEFNTYPRYDQDGLKNNGHLKKSSSVSSVSEIDEKNQNVLKLSTNGHVKKSSSVSSVREIDGADVELQLNGHVKRSSSVSSVSEIDREFAEGYDSNQEGNDRNILRDVEIAGPSDHHDTAELLEEENEEARSFYDDMDAQIWIPPEPENEEDDNEDSVATLDDDDDEYGDGEWGKSSSLNIIEEVAKRSSEFQEEREQAMEEVMSGKFKSLVSQMLKSVGIANPEEDGESWLDVVTSLSWEAASFLKPDAGGNKAMDPAGYVKVKCVATGARNQSQLIKGLVFKKHAAHKHMPTQYKKPKLLLMKGMLGQSSGLSSFNSMISQDKDNLKKDNLTDSLKTLIENMEACHPNVVLVEKSVSRDALEAIHKMGMTLVSDMKLHRLERVARCTASPILSSDNMLSQKLKQCESVYFEKFVEEHALVGEGEKKPRKTLMFLDGCSSHLDCTVLLKGSHSDELKRVKAVVQCAVVMAYHFILETSFLLDQKAMFSTITSDGSLMKNKPIRVSSFISRRATAAFGDGAHFSNGFHGETTSVIESSIQISSVSDEEEPLHDEGSTSKVASSSDHDIPISNGIHEVQSQSLASEDKSATSYEPRRISTSSETSFFPESLKKVIGENLPLVSPAAYQSMCTYFEINEREPDAPTSVASSDLPFEMRSPRDIETRDSSNDEKILKNDANSLAASSQEAGGGGNSVDDGEDTIQKKDDISTVLDSESILVLMSRRNAHGGRICEQSHFSHIKFYRNFDVPLGKFLKENLLNQSLTCKTCSELPEAHYQYYAHHNKQLTIRVKHLQKKHLPGFSEGKLWMWSCCGKCNPKNGIARSTKRVLISSSARELSFGKFLELSFSSDSSFNRLASCGHSLHRDFLQFFGLGPMVAMFRYSQVATYTVSVPSQKMSFTNSIKDEWMKKETENVYTKGVMMFTEIADYLKKIKPQFSGVSFKLDGSLKEFLYIEDMLASERDEFEEKIRSACVDNGISVCNLLSLNRSRWDLLLEACVWVQRLQLLLSFGSVVSTHAAATNNVKADMKQLTNGKTEATSSIVEGEMKRSISGVETREANGKDVETETKKPGLNESNEASIKCVDVMVETENPAGQPLTEGVPCDDDLIQVSREQVLVGEPTIAVTVLPSDDQADGKNSGADGHLTKDLQLADIDIPITGDQDNSKNKPETIECLPVFDLENSKGRVWNTFAVIRQECMNDLEKGQLPNFENSPKAKLPHPPDFLPTVYQVIAEESSRLHIPLGNENHVVSDYDGEVSSIIACALGLMQDLTHPIEYPDEEKLKASRTADHPVSLPRAISAPSPHQSSSISTDTDMIRSTPSLTLESRLSSFDGLNLLDSLVSFGALHPEVPLGTEKHPGKGRYSVVCMYAKEFRDLRQRCCPSEVDYIASLSRCKNWDAKGGKSKSFFAKTLDDRLIIKEIKKTELESFMKFAPDYFRYMNQSFELGNQTCLAKILGIYQVTIRQPKNGKEVKHDLMVMENLSFGRNIIRQYDLKGALHARFTTTADGSGDVLLDENFVIDMNVSPIYVGQKAKRLLQRAVWNDTTFLNSINVMDYSLLVGVDRQRRELVCGIIDYLRQYTWDKQLETWVKSSLVVPKNVLPTIISPKEYKKRFRKFMDTHFLSVPDHWCSQRSSNPCKLCGIKGDDSPGGKAKRQEELNDF